MSNPSKSGCRVGLFFCGDVGFHSHNLEKGMKRIFLRWTDDYLKYPALSLLCSVIKMPRIVTVVRRHSHFSEESIIAGKPILYSFSLFLSLPFSFSRFLFLFLVIRV